jgi:hypothetical protein
MHDETETTPRRALVEPPSVALDFAEPGRPRQRQDVEVEVPGGPAPDLARPILPMGRRGESEACGKRQPQQPRRSMSFQGRAIRQAGAFP